VSFISTYSDIKEQRNKQEIRAKGNVCKTIQVSNGADQILVCCISFEAHFNAATERTKLKMNKNLDILLFKLFPPVFIKVNV